MDPLYTLEFLWIEIPQNVLQALGKLILVSHLNPFEFFFHCKKQIEVTGARSGESRGCGM
jgi:hypothetical protein